MQVAQPATHVILPVIPAAARRALDVLNVHLTSSMIHPRLLLSAPVIIIYLSELELIFENRM